jgi:hypothetical protein
LPASGITARTDVRPSTPEVSSRARRGEPKPGHRRLISVVVVLLTGAAWWWWVIARTHRGELPGRTPVADHAPPAPVRGRNFATVSDAAPTVSGALSPDKAARVAAILSDYDAMRTKASAEHEAMGDNYPGGLNAFLRQLVLLEREKRLDLATALTPGEMEDYELRESPAGHTVQELLDHSAATDDQRRAVFRLQREFDDRFALSFDSTPRAAWERERARVDLQEKIRVALGESLFATWLRGEGDDYRHFTSFVAQHQLPPATALELWRIKNDYTLRRLELSARNESPSTPSSAAHRELVEATTARVHALLGPTALSHARPELLSWLPKR